VGVRVQKVRANIVGGPTHVDTDTKSPMDHQSGQQKAFGNGNGGSYKTRSRSLFPPSVSRSLIVYFAVISSWLNSVGGKKKEKS